ncbi:MAG: DUF2802 domain-containing protein [Methylovulum sp.]|nr:DUF2802 domain-containing protein [Methylovulum sp.]MCF7998253.1 DUF2802 domain-containing protein [Methylovulum sp.]
MQNDPIQIVILTVFVMGVFIMALVLVWLVRALLELKLDYQRLSERLHSGHHDIAGLCAAAVIIDRRIDTHEELSRQLAEKVNELSAISVTVMQTSEPPPIASPEPEPESQEQSEHPYRLAIQRVRSGANIQELMQSSGLSHDEAALLIRLHGNKDAF